MLNHTRHMTGPEDNLYGPYPYRKTNIWAIKLNKKEIIQAPSQMQQYYTMMVQIELHSARLVASMCHLRSPRKPSSSS